MLRQILVLTLVGVVAGWLKVTIQRGLELLRVNTHNVVAVRVCTVVALAVFAAQLELLWWTGVGLAVGDSIGGRPGAHTTVSHAELLIRRVLYLALTAFIIRLLCF